MLPLMYSAWIINRRLLFMSSPFLVLYLAQLVAFHHSGNLTTTAFLMVFFETTLTIAFTLQGLFQPVEEFILSLPVSRSQIVRTKYLFSLLGLITGSVLPLLTLWLAHLLVPAYVPVFSREVLEIGGVAAIYLAFGVFLFLSFIYQFGPEKGSAIFSITMVLFIVGCLAWKGIRACSQIFMDFNLHILESGIFALEVVAGVLTFGLASLFFSIWTYRKKVAIGGHPLSIAKIRAMLHFYLQHKKTTTAVGSSRLPLIERLSLEKIKKSRD